MPGSDSLAGPLVDGAHLFLPSLWRRAIPGPQVLTASKVSQSRHKVSGLKFGHVTSSLEVSNCYSSFSHVEPPESVVDQFETNLGPQTWRKYPWVCRRGEGQYGIQAREGQMNFV